MASLTLRQFSLFFLLILPCWRVFFLGSPALHYAGTDRLQMIGVSSLHVDRSWQLVSSSSGSLQQCFIPPKVLGVRHKWSQILCSTLFLQLISESCNKILKIY